MTVRLVTVAVCIAGMGAGDTSAQSAPDARSLGVRLEGEPGPHNGITDVPGVEVGHSTIIEGEGRLVVGEGPVRTGVTAILPRGSEAGDSAFAAWWLSLIHISEPTRQPATSGMPSSA